VGKSALTEIGRITITVLNHRISLYLRSQHAPDSLNFRNWFSGFAATNL